MEYSTKKDNQGDRFEINDPRYNTRSIFKTSLEAIEKATTLGVGRFNYITQEREIYVIEKNIEDGRWYQIERDPKQIRIKKYIVPVEEIQKSIDEKNLQSIINNADRRATLTGFDKESDAMMAKADILYFGKIQEKEAQKTAAKIMAKNATSYPDYWKTLQENATETVEKITAVSEAGKEEKKSKTNDEHPNNTVESDEIFTARESIKKPVIPADIMKKYVRVENKYYAKHNTDTPEFEDKGNKLETKLNNDHIADVLVSIAESRGWDEIKVSGSESFRREVFLRAASHGMQVKGYTPNDQDRARLKQMVGESKSNIIMDNQTNTKTDIDPVKEDKTLTLVSHGAAKYQNDEKNNDSYYVTTRDKDEKLKTTWGVDLERAINESGAKLGDKIDIINEGQQQVSIKIPIRDETGKVVSFQTKETNRNSWNVKLAETWANNDPQQSAKMYPELANATALAVAIDKKAEADGLNSVQRSVVAARTKQNIINSIEKGNLPGVKIKEEVEITNIKKQEYEPELSR